MTDNIITKDEAIARKKAELPCETCWPDGWLPTMWRDFDLSHAKFRKPPEPRRVAREWWICDDGFAVMLDHHNPIPHGLHVREVLPGDVVVQRMTEAQAATEFHKRSGENHSTAREERIWIESRRALGLIGEGS